MQQWEYKWCAVLLDVEMNLVAYLGRQGWELVSVQPFQSTFTGELWAGGPGGSRVSSYMFFFKRPKGPEGDK